MFNVLATARYLCSTVASAAGCARASRRLRLKSRPGPRRVPRSAGPAYIKTYEDIKEILNPGRFQVVDAVPPAASEGTEPERRDGGSNEQGAQEVPA